MPLVGPETCFALKGGSAINLFVRDLPRISVDLDLTFLPVKDRAQSLAEMITPQFQPLEAVFDAQFKGMTSQPISVAELEETLRALVVMVQDRLTDAQRKFLYKKWGQGYICDLIYAVSFSGDSYKTFSIKLIARELVPGDFHPLVETTKKKSN